MKSRYTNVKYICEISWYFSVHCLLQSLRNYKEEAKIKPSEKALAMPGQWTPVTLMRVCLQIDWIIHQRHVHRKGIPTCLHQPITVRDTIPTGANQGGCTKQAQWPLTDLPSATLEVRATDYKLPLIVSLELWHRSNVLGYMLQSYIPIYKTWINPGCNLVTIRGCFPLFSKLSGKSDKDIVPVGDAETGYSQRGLYNHWVEGAQGAKSEGRGQYACAYFIYALNPEGYTSSYRICQTHMFVSFLKHGDRQNW